MEQRRYATQRNTETGQRHNVTKQNWPWNKDTLQHSETDYEQKTKCNIVAHWEWKLHISV